MEPKIESDEMKIGDIKAGMNNVSIEAKVIDKSDTRVVQTRYGKRNVADVTLEDDTGEIKLSLWQDQIGEVAIGDQVTLTGAYVTQFREQMQLNIPKSGKLEVGGKGGSDDNLKDLE